jgi:NAD(P)-dependent dehydrogenase (short-subunit alcohol dehydrogenase family)
VKAALVTGGSRGIGQALAQRLSSEGYALTLVARSPERLEATAAELGGEVTSFVADLREEAAVRAAVAHHAAAYGRLDVLVNNAGGGTGQAVGELKTSRIDVQLALNLRTPILFYREALPLLRQAGGALVVNVASVAGLDGQPWLSVYSAAKAGLIAFTQAMNKELSEHAIRSCALCPGAVDTDLTAYVDGPRENLIPPSDVAEALGLLLRLSPHCTIPQLVLE